MQAAGRRAVELAKQTGSWSALESSEASVIPEDLATAMAGYPGSRPQFEVFPPGVRGAILQWSALAKREDTRQRRVNETARLAQQGVRANEWRPKA